MDIDKDKTASGGQLDKREREALQASEAKYRALVETTGTGYLILDPEGRVVDANKEYVRLSGHNELGEILGHSVVEWTAGYEKVKNAEAVAKCVKEGFVRNLVIDYVDSSGKVTPVEISATMEGKGKDARIISLCRDITERRRAEEALRFTNALLTTQAEASLDGVLVVDEAGKIVSINKQFAEIWEIPPAVLAARSDELALRAVLDKLVKPEEFLARVNYLYGHKEEKSMEEVALRDGRTLDRYSAPMAGSDGKYYGRVWHFRDVTERKRVEAVLAESEEKYRSLFESSRDALMTIAPPSWRFTSGNPATLALFGAKNEEELEACTPGELSPERQPDGRLSLEKAGEMIGAAMREGSHFFEWTHKRVNGGEFLATVMLNRVELDGKMFLQATVRDITRQKASEAALQESKNLLESVVENVPLTIFLKTAADLRFVMLNRASEDLFGRDRKAMLGKGDLDFFPPEQANFFISKDREVLAGEKGILDIQQEPIMTAKQGQRLLHTRKVVIKGPDGAAKYLLGISEDITERKQAEGAIREAFEMANVLNAMLQQSLANNPLQEKLGNHLSVLFRLPWLSIQPKGAVFLMNAKGMALVLMAQRGLAPALLDACANVPLGRCLCGKAAGTGQVVEAACVGADHHITYEGMVPHGHYCAPISAGGKILGVLNLYLTEGVSLTDSQRRFIKSVTDIMAENILHAQVEEKFAQSQRMESVGRLAGGVAHDFNNILTAIKCYAEFIRKDLDPQDPKAEDVREILTASDRAVSLTRQLLAFSRRQIMTPKVADLNKCVGDVTNMLRRLIGEDIALGTKLAAMPCLALLDTGQMEQVLVNLVVNARDAMAKGGGIELITELLPASEALALAHPDLPRGPLVCLKVSDTGTGMTAEVKSHLFEPFFTTKEQGKGTGLGLSTVLGIVKQSGGDIEVDSEPGKGTTFRIYFPYCETGAATADADAAGQSPGEAKGRETVLFVEDEESLRRLGKRVLESSGYTVLTAANGAEALKELERRGKPVDLLVTDVVMPGISGRELARELARTGGMGRTLYMSGYTDDAIVKHGVLEPGLAFIYKPFTVDALLLKVRTVLDAPADQARA